ncbi:MAG TPA: C4-type zinc ribbon domain-containing protein [Isosphaeraceae bacterium]|jgi:hypothetical protein|nr:C4-type zinc ribbon domain-containing protein [Isosphaeraceae bacterium]
MPATAENLRDLHSLHQRAKAIRDRLASAPKTLAARQGALDNRKAALDAAKKALQETRSNIKKKELTLQGQQGKSDDLKVKLNQAKKNDEYKAIQNQLAHDAASMARLEDEILHAMTDADAHAEAMATLEAEVKALDAEVATLRADLEAQAAGQQAQLQELEAAITAAEAIIPEDRRDQYRRLIRQRGSDALAAVDNGACTGCYVSVTAQMINELINVESLVYCKTCGRILYLADEDRPATRRSSR